MAGSVITWLSSFTFLGGLGNELASSVEVRALKNSTVQETVNTASSAIHDEKESLSVSSPAVGDTSETGSVPSRANMSKSRPSSRRQSNVAGMCSPACIWCMFTMLTCAGENNRISPDGIQEGGPERHVKFNIDFDEWRRYHPQPNLILRGVGTSHQRDKNKSRIVLFTLVGVLMPYLSPPRKAKNKSKLPIIFTDYARNTQTNLLSADTTFSSGLRRIRSSQVSLSSLLDGKPTPAHSPTQSTHPVPLSAQHNMLTSAEDLTKFPSESLHSFSFSQPRDPTAILESRQNVLRKSIDYMKDKLHGGAPTTPWAETTLGTSPIDMRTFSKDEDVLQSLKRANLIPEYWDETSLPPPTAPITTVENPFDSIDTELLTMPNRKQKKRTPTDLSGYKMQAKLFDAVTKPYSINTSAPIPVTPSSSRDDRRLSMHLITSQVPGGAAPGVVPIHTTTRLAPTMQAIFSTENVAPWKILNANDLSCLEFGVTEQEIKRGVSILEYFDSGRREWVESRLKGLQGTSPTIFDETKSFDSFETTATEFPDVLPKADPGQGKDEAKERVVLCGEVVSMRKMKQKDGAKKIHMAASLWVKEKV